MSSVKMNPLDTRAPWVLVIYSGIIPGTGNYFENALSKYCNILSIRIDELNILSYFGKVSNSLPMKLVQRYLKFHGMYLSLFDLAVVIDPVSYPFDFHRHGVPSAYIATESHSWKERHFGKARVQDYDAVFVQVAKYHVKLYKEWGCNEVYWLPNAAEPTVHRPWKTDEVFDLVHIGSTTGGRTQRGKFLAELAYKLRDYKIYFGKQYLHDMAFYYSSSKMVVNYSQHGGVTARPFEVPACRKLLLTDDIGCPLNGLLDLFSDKVHLCLYHSMDDLVELFKHYMGHPEERQRIADAGYKEVLEKHTFTHRAKTLLDTMKVQGHKNQAEPKEFIF